MLKLDILVVEDEPLAQKVLAQSLIGHSVDFASDMGMAREKLESRKHDLCFIDLKLGRADDCSGLRLIPLASSKQIYTVVMSGHDSEKHVKEAYDLGCDDFYAKGNENANVDDVLVRFLNKREKGRKESLFAERFITEDAETRESISEALKYAASELPVLILGPSGTGKTSLARIIHDHSHRSGEFIAINCSAYAEDLLEAELFGYRKGAFTGASENRKGKLLLADQGTLFLDEIGAMSLKMQTKLLKAIEERSFYPLGSEKPETSRFRLISATLEDLQGLIKAGKLRFDFFQRIHGLPIKLKPLAQRKSDIGPLISHFTRGGRKLSFSAEARELILGRDWPGNARELKKFVDLLAAGQEGRISPETVQKLFKTLSVEEGEGFVSEEQYRFAKHHGLDEAVDRFVDTIIRRSLADNGGKKTAVLSDLDIATRILYTSLNRGENK
jgi:DNA-binding NtrC family response regulator